jgi:hypothetical protein
MNVARMNFSHGDHKCVAALLLILHVSTLRALPVEIHVWPCCACRAMPRRYSGHHPPAPGARYPESCSCRCCRGLVFTARMVQRDRTGMSGRDSTIVGPVARAWYGLEMMSRGLVGIARGLGGATRLLLCLGGSGTGRSYGSCAVGRFIYGSCAVGRMKRSRAAATREQAWRGSGSCAVGWGWQVPRADDCQRAGGAEAVEAHVRPGPRHQGPRDTHRVTPRPTPPAPPPCHSPSDRISEGSEGSRKRRRTCTAGHQQHEALVEQQFTALVGSSM